MVREAEKRKRKYDAKVDADVLASQTRRLKPYMVSNVSRYFTDITQVETTVKKLVEAEGVTTLEAKDYLNFAREMYKLSKKFSGVTLQAEAQLRVNKWVSRGLIGSLLTKIAQLFGVTPEVAPSPPLEAKIDAIEVKLDVIKPEIELAEHIIKFNSAEALDAIASASATDTTEKQITVSLPSGASIVRAMLGAFITAMNNSANAQKIDIDVKGRLSGGSWSTFFSQDDVIGFPASDGATTGFVPLQDVSALITGAGTYGFKLTVQASNAGSVRYTTQYLLIVTYKMS